MFDIGFWELALIGVIALMVVGPERLPALARTVGLWVGRMRRYVAHVREDIEREIHAEEVRKLIETPANSIGEFGDAINETRSVLKDAEQQLSQVEREAGRIEDELGDDDEAAEADVLDPPAGQESDQGPFASGNTELLNPTEDLPGADDGTQPAVPESQPAVDADEERRHAKP